MGSGVPGVVGVGIDAVDVPRFRTVLGRTPGMRARLFTAAELDSLAGRADDLPALAARFAAREATMKALGVGLGAFSFHDVEIHRDDSGAPQLRCRGAAEALAAARGVNAWHVSLTHTAHVAMAVVLACADASA